MRGFAIAARVPWRADERACARPLELVPNADAVDGAVYDEVFRLVLRIVEAKGPSCGRGTSSKQYLNI